MEWVVDSKRQAVAIAKLILEAGDREMAFRLQKEEIDRVSSTQASINELDLKQSRLGSGSDAKWDEDFDVALEVARHELETFVDQWEETTLSLFEIRRIALQDNSTPFVVVTDEEVDDEFESVVIRTREIWSSHGRGCGSHHVKKSALRVPSSQPSTSKQWYKKTIRTQKNLYFEDEEGDPQEGNEDAMNLCEICFDATLQEKPFITLEGCGHQFCEECVSRHATSLISGGKISITCLQANCVSTISPRQLLPLLDERIFDILTCRSRESANNAAPQKNELSKEAKQLLLMAKELKWQRCSGCGALVERLSGCPHMICRCGHHFCYNCGDSWKTNDQSCSCS